MEENNPLMVLSNALAEAAETAGRSTVLVDARKRMPASGVLIDGNTVLTADHVVERDEDLKIMLPDGESDSAQLLGRDPGTDLAVLRLENASGQPASVLKGAARVGELVLSLGRPSSAGIQASLGVVSAIGGGIRRVHRRRGPAPAASEQFIRTDAIPYPGFSGGPLVHVSGRIAGLNTSGLVRGISLAIPFPRALQVASALMEHGSVRRGYLGIRSQMAPLSAAFQEKLDREQSSGLLVIWVEEGAAAALAGLIVGDILVAFDGEPISDHEELQRSILNAEVGQAVVLEVLRGGESRQVSVVVGERPD
jgi:S1-C subfamily serine protease